jgi:hypothetical protein
MSAVCGGAAAADTWRPDTWRPDNWCPDTWPHPGSAWPPRTRTWRWLASTATAGRAWSDRSTAGDRMSPACSGTPQCPRRTVPPGRRSHRPGAAGWPDNAVACVRCRSRPPDTAAAATRPQAPWTPLHAAAPRHRSGRAEQPRSSAADTHGNTEGRACRHAVFGRGSG